MMRSILIQAFIALNACAAARVPNYDPIAGYQPFSLVGDMAAIDQDQKAMEELLVQNQQDAFDQALRFYKQGAHSLSVAVLTLDLGLPIHVPEGTEMMGYGDNDTVINGTIYADAFPGDTQVMFQYPVSSDDKHLACQVGARPIGEQELGGCLLQHSNITMMLGNAEYRYDPFVDNINTRTLQSLSLDAKRLLYDCQNCPHDDFLKFHAYYGDPDYADTWISAAFQGEETKLLNGNIDFSELSLLGRGEAIKKGVSSMSVWMHVIGLMESSLDSCNPGCLGCNDESSHIWDEAAALYAGSLEGHDGSGHGFFSYALADKRCTDFRTCGKWHKHNEGTSAVNREVINLLGLGRLDVSNGVCELARDHKERIVNLMTVPLIQSALKYTYIRERQESGEKQDAAAAVFAASVLPIIHDCNEDDATLIWENMAIGSFIVEPDFVAVKEAFERNYECLRLTCADVGGLYNAQSRKYFQDARPCGARASEASVGQRILFAVSTLVGLLLILACCCFCLRCGEGDEWVDDTRTIASNDLDDYELEEESLIIFSKTID